MKAVALIALTCLALTACGGDDSSPAASGGSGSSNNGGAGGTGGTGSGGSGSGGNGGSGGSGGSGGGTLTWRYEAQPVAADKASFLTLVNSEGAKGYRYLGDYYYSSSNGGTQSIFVNDGTAQTYTYQLQNAPADMTSFVNTANAQGSSGYRYEGPLTYGDLYRKDGGSSATYTYTATGLPADANAFLTQANGQGQSGYWFLGPIAVASVQANIYMKNNASSATYTYDALAPTSTVSDFIAQANSEGAKGYRAKGAMAFGTAISWVYVKDQTQSPTFTYQSAAIQSTGASFVQQSNTFGGQGSAYLSDMALGTTPPLAMASFYFTPKNCTGFLCTTLNPLTQN
ncbi:MULTISPECIES: hypothetical protein [unclassified Burkholderia]|uniref:hypothetical protein n=1 Tax=unclassified Burkholderia TaxID=2613784 RepID=UPI0014224F0A|nr:MULTISPECIES: hypothetical protein [unclassified Burkholderia]NIE56326.1 hypothetical protein [Burkholderia sp. Ap-955]NIF08331.1 hypothetical protein [Burkholderia sp. Ax-1735]NIG00985.1 hypothetical protein [Burkholderia sp. Tr-849]